MAFPGHHPLVLSLSVEVMMKHIVLHAMDGWGHSKPLTGVLVRITEARKNVIVTFLVGGMYKNIVEELGKLGADRLKRIQDRVHIVDFRGAVNDPNDSALPFEAYYHLDPSQGFYPTFEALCKCRPIICNSSGKTIVGLPQPRLAIVDPFAGCDMEVLHSFTNGIPIIAWVSGPVNGTIREFCPPRLGGHDNIWIKAEQEIGGIHWDSPAAMKIAERLYTSMTGDIVRIAGYPPVYDHEWFVQDLDHTLTAKIVLKAWRFFNQADGAFSSTTSVLEKDATATITKYMKSLGKDFFSVGFAADIFQHRKECPDAVEAHVVNFLDRQQKEYGESSVVYIAFGTYWWPSEPTKLFALIEELIINRVPFLFAHPSFQSIIPKELSSQIAESGIGLEIDWAPQVTVLKHPATGWFVTHGGWNSVQESIASGVPLIVWPISADQPMNAVLVALVHQVGFELLAVRAGEKGTMKPHRLADSVTSLFTLEAFRSEVKELLIKLRTEDGKFVRDNARRLSRMVARLWDENGEARRELQSFLVKYVDRHGEERSRL